MTEIIDRRQRVVAGRPDRTRVPSRARTVVRRRPGGATAPEGFSREPATARRRPVACFIAEHRVLFWNNRPPFMPPPRRQVPGRGITKVMWRELSRPDGARSWPLPRSANSSWRIPRRVDFASRWCRCAGEKQVCHVPLQPVAWPPHHPGHLETRVHTSHVRVMTAAIGRRPCTLAFLTAVH
jgi:hypothetical protein